MSTLQPPDSRNPLSDNPGTVHACENSCAEWNTRPPVRTPCAARASQGLTADSSFTERQRNCLNRDRGRTTEAEIVEPPQERRVQRRRGDRHSSAIGQPPLDRTRKDWVVV